MSNNKDTKQESGYSAHREHELYSYYANELLANAEASKATTEKTEQVKSDTERK